MTATDLDPPPTLRLVASNDAALSTHDSRYRHSSPLYGEARELYRQVLESALASGQLLDRDALRVVLATKQATTATPIRAFTASQIWQLMFVDVVTWCRNRKLEVPYRAAGALIQVIDHLDATGGFAAPSDPVPDLYDALDECTGGWVDDHPSRARPAAPRKTTGRRSLRSERGSKRT